MQTMANQQTMAAASEAERPEVKTYFEDEAAGFDSIYSGEKSGLMRLMDRIFRKDMYERFRLTIEECEDDSIQSVLDIGTGTGRFLFPLASKKSRLVGIDFSAPMIEMARKYAEQQGVADKCEFHVQDFLDASFDEPFDAIMAIGLFDYLQDPSVFLKKMAGVAQKKIIASWPLKGTWRAPIRWVRLRMRGCPVYFFTRREVENYYRDAGLKIQRFEKVGKLYFVVATPGDAA